jgi:hypothetical protein
MPYISKAARTDIRRRHRKPCSPGELNFCITDLCLSYLYLAGRSYETINGIMGALTCTQQEFYRRVAVPYEEEKKGENGDVF